MEIEELVEIANTAIAPDFRGRLLARGQARSIVWRNGELPAQAPDFSTTLTYDLQSFGMSMLGIGIRLLDNQQETGLVRRVFEQAGNALESVVRNNNPELPDYSFNKILAAASFHLGRFSARAYSLLFRQLQAENFSKIEHALALLILRSLDDLSELTYTENVEGGSNEDAIKSVFEAALENLGDFQDDESASETLFAAIDGCISNKYFSALSTFLLALETGDGGLVDDALIGMDEAKEIAGELNLVPQWWCIRLTKLILDDLWDSSFHSVFPETPPGIEQDSWRYHANVFKDSLYRRDRSEIELWPSQITAATKALATPDSFVTSLPTSAGKTRIAELAILRCLAQEKRVFFITPLRSLSSQTESTLRKTFNPLGKTISSLYGSVGISGIDTDVMNQCDIVVGTPEKLDFALRSDPAILNDVGLVVLDEGHLIGLGEREIRYEIQIQRLLSRADACERRILCLSAVLPSGEQYEDFVGWVSRDSEEPDIRDQWRPTRLRFGELLWNGDAGRLQIEVEEESTFVPRYLESKQPTQGLRRNSFPNDRAELVLATAWKLASEGQTVLIYCPLRKSVESLAGQIAKLEGYGLLHSVLEADKNDLALANSIGTEWFGPDHSILQCLSLGVAVHHGQLPTAFRKEVENLLSAGKLRIIISSPTLSQGLNLSATAIVFNSIHRNRSVIESSDFRNIVGRAGRAFVDTEGLVLFPIYDRHNYRLGIWKDLIDDTKGHEMESGLLRLVISLLRRLSRSLGTNKIQELEEYILNNVEAWEFPEIENESAEEAESNKKDWNDYLVYLDTALIGLLCDNDELDGDNLAEALDEVLGSSLWQRRLARREAAQRNILNLVLEERAKFVWDQTDPSSRRANYFAGVGLTTGQLMEAKFEEAFRHLFSANVSMMFSAFDDACDSVIAFAEIVFQIKPFVPDSLPEDWPEVLRRWLSGLPLNEDDQEYDGNKLQFVESSLVYKLPWAMEAIRLRAEASPDLVVKLIGLELDDIELGYAVSALECGTMNRAASLLIQSGFNLRNLAIQVVNETDPNFTSYSQLRRWLVSPQIQALSAEPDWPSLNSNDHWNNYINAMNVANESEWQESTEIFPVAWNEGIEVPESFLRLHLDQNGSTIVLNPDNVILGNLRRNLLFKPKGLLKVRKFFIDDDFLEVTYNGPSGLENIFE